MRIIELGAEDRNAIRQVASMLVQAFREHSPDSWPDMDSALREVHQALKAGNINRIAIDQAGTVLGWVGGISEYRGKAWELHPLVISPAYQRQGIGRALVADFEKQVKSRGGVTIYLGTDDEDNMTTLSNTDLYPNVFEKIANIRNLRGHPYEFYQKQGFTIVGVIPDANGLGKPDIIMAKRVAR